MKAELISKVGLSFVFSILMLSSVAFAQSTIEGIINTFKTIGVFQFYLPFLLVFAVLHGLLSKTGILKGGLSAIISLVAAAFIMIYTPVGITFAQFLANFFAGSVIVILTIVVVVIFVTMLVSSKIIPDPKDIFKTGGSIWLFMGIFAVIAAAIFFASGGLGVFPGGKGFGNTLGGISTTTWAIIILIVGTGLIALLASMGGKGGGGPGG